jgi:hypothetical protein
MQNQPVDNNTYNVITALAKNLEACEVYGKYGKDGNPQLWEQLYQKAREQVSLLQQELTKIMTHNGQAYGSSQQADLDRSYVDPRVTQTVNQSSKVMDNTPGKSSGQEVTNPYN